MSNMKNQQADKYNINLINFTITKRTPYELTLPEFVSVRFSSLFFKCFSIFLLCSFMNQRFMADSVVDYPRITG
jgi:hypothetical protein